MNRSCLNEFRSCHKLLAQNTQWTEECAHRILREILLDAVRLLDGATQQAARQQREDRREPGEKAIGKIPAGFRTLARHAAGFHYVPVASDDGTLG